MPKPTPNESKDEYVSRCMGDKRMNEKFPDQKQRAAVCYSYWDRKDETSEPILTFKQFLIMEDGLNDK